MFIPNAMIDTLFDYTSILGEHSLCKLPPASLGKEVAIIGGGAAGLLAAHELLKMGVKPIIYEFAPRLGGRLYSRSFLHTDDDIAPFAEMGAMRIPSCSHVFFHYAKQLQLTCSPTFPAPGEIDTLVYYQKKLYQWKPGSPPPGPFAKTRKLWEMFIAPYVNSVHQEWEKGNLDKVKTLWQSYVDLFKNKTLFEVIVDQSQLASPQHIDHFGSLGFGTVGLHPFFQFSFLEILRILINTFFDNHTIIMEGTTQFVERLYQKKVNTGDNKYTSLAEQGSAQLNITVLRIDYNCKTKNPVILYRDQQSNYFEKEFSAVIYTGSTNAAHLLGLSSSTKTGVFLFNELIRDTIKKAPMFYSSKTFICTKNKFWKKLKMPPCILTDEINKNTLFLDYPFTERGVVCLSYTLGLDALKLTAVDPEHRLIIFKRIMEEISSVSNKELFPINNEILTIDWINEKFQNGAFKIAIPGSEEGQQALYYQFQTALTLEEDKGVYLAGDGICWSSGWIEGALTTSLNAVYAVAKRFGAEISGNTPLSQRQDLFNY